MKVRSFSCQYRGAPAFTVRLLFVQATNILEMGPLAYTHQSWHGYGTTRGYDHSRYHLSGSIILHGNCPIPIQVLGAMYSPNVSEWYTRARTDIALPPVLLYPNFLEMSLHANAWPLSPFGSFQRFESTKGSRTRRSSLSLYFLNIK